MESVGQKLHEARLRLGLALDDVSAITRISLKNLQAIENDDLTQISSPFFYRSFAKQFAEAVRLEHAGFDNAMKAAAQLIPEPLMPGQPGAPVPPKVPGLGPERTRRIRWLFSFGSLVVTLVACSGLYGVWQDARANEHAAISAFLNSVFQHARSEPSPQANRIIPRGRPVHPAKPSAVLPAVNQPAPAPLIDSEAPPTEGEFKLQLSALETTWLSVATDGKEVFRGMLQATDTKTLEGRETARVRTGNAGGVEVTFNGKAIGALGRKGQVRTVLFTRNGYEVLEPQARIELASFYIGR